ncbi:MAG: hypothetical protein DCC75_03420 [Proteobacteria bacterium]|nr:MAG: hypothetical protein DCC75_03420 [Pseudomonadota bacterium]
MDQVNLSGLIERLYASFAHLEQSINGARTALAGRGNTPPEIFRRLDSYKQILSSQKALADELGGLMSTGNLEEVGRRVKLINGLSAMIIEDAKGVLMSLGDTTVSHDPTEETPIC